MKEAAGDMVVPDYATFCPAYWRGCFACPEFMVDKVRFCRKWNRAFYGVDVVSPASMAMDGHPCPQSRKEAAA